MIKIELISEWMKIFPYSLCLDEIYFRERNSVGTLIYELTLSTHQFGYIINPFYENFRELNPESLIYKCHSKDFENGDWAEKQEEECQSVEEFYNHLLEKREIICVFIEVKEAYNELLKICESTMKNKNKLFVFSEYL